MQVSRGALHNSRVIWDDDDENSFEISPNNPLVALGAKSALMNWRKQHSPRIVCAPMPLRGTSKAYIIDRLRREEGLSYLADAIEAGRISSHAVGLELGWISRPDLVGVRDSQARQRHFLFQQLVREAARAARDR